MDIKIRKARLDEAGEMTDLIMRSKRSNGYDDDFMAACEFVLAVTPERLSNADYWVAEADQLCGCASLKRHPGSTAAEVTNFFIDPDLQGKGIGRLLWKTILQRAKMAGLTDLYLDSDPFAVPFYQKMGFKIIGKSPSEAIPGRQLPLMHLAIIP